MCFVDGGRGGDVQQNTEQAAKPRATSSTHASSKVIQLGLEDGKTADGLTASQNVPSFRCFQVRTGLACLQNLGVSFLTVMEY